MNTRHHDNTYSAGILGFGGGSRRRALVCAALAFAACDDSEQFVGDADLAEPAVSGEAAAALDELQLGDDGPQVRAAHEYLRKFGYFPNAELAAQYPGWTPVIAAEPDDFEQFGQPLEDALKRYQAGYGLAVTGRLDTATQALMQRPRCSFPDHYASQPAANSVDEFGFGDAGSSPAAGLPGVPDVLANPIETSEYKVAPYSLAVTDLRWKLLQPSWDINAGFQAQALQAAMNTWSAAAPVVFTQRDSPDVTVNFVSKVHGDGLNFDDWTRAHTLTPSCDQNTASFICSSQIHLNDQSFVWGDGNGNTVLDIQTNLLHELGHAIGLDHSADPSAVMYGAMAGGTIRRVLAPDDISGIKALYPTFRDMRIFEPMWYLLLNPDLANIVGWDTSKGSDHWLKFGRIQGFTGSPAFDITYYKKENPSAPKDPIQAFWHWRELGLPAGRASSPAFNAKFYLDTYPDLKNALGANNYPLALVHWMVNGIDEGRRGSSLFNPVYYLAVNKAVAQMYGATNYKGALIHWLTVGYKQGLKGSP
jgi:hypothetical protein